MAYQGGISIDSVIADEHAVRTACNEIASRQRRSTRCASNTACNVSQAVVVLLPARFRIGTSLRPWNPQPARRQ